MAFFASHRKLKPVEADEAGELNIVPYLDILMNLIIFMLLSMAGLATFGVINVSAPAVGTGPSTDSQQELLVTVGVTQQGFFVASRGGVLPGVSDAATGPTIPARSDGTLDYDALTAKLAEVKAVVSALVQQGRATPASQSKLMLTADARVDYDTIVRTMDAARQTPSHAPLFSDVTLATF